VLKKIFTKVAKKIYRYDPRYEIKKNDKFKYKKTLVYSVDHSWNTLEWCLPGLYYLKKHYDVNMVFLAADTDLWQRFLEEKQVYSLVEQVFDIIIINTQDNSKCNWFQRKIHRLWKSLLEEESLKYFFSNMNIDMILSFATPSYVNKYFKNYHPDTIKVRYEHGACNIISPAPPKYLNNHLSGADYFLCACKAIFDLAEESKKNKLIEVGSSQFDNWWRDLIAGNDILDVQKQLDNTKKTIMILLPALGNIRINTEEKVAIAKIIRYFYGKENIILKFHPREKIENRMRFMKNITNSYQNDKIIITTIPTECIAKIVDCAIVVGISSAAGAVVINDVPAIEFCGPKIMDTYHSETGRYGTILKTNKAIMSADNYDTLMDAVNGILYRNEWDNYRGKYKEFIPDIYYDNKASQRLAEAIVHIMENKK